MTCPECNLNFEREDGFCPRCGAGKGVVKTSTIFISAGATRKVYRSVEEVPDRLKRQLLRSTNGLNSATIVIADRQGGKEIAKAIRNLAALQGGPPGKPDTAAAAKLSPAVLRSVALILLAAVAGVVWIAFR